MSSYQNPMARIASLLGLSHVSPPSTPATITGKDRMVRSYNLVIAERVSENVIEIYEERSSATTNRHTQSARRVAADYGFKRTGDAKNGYGRYQRGN